MPKYTVELFKDDDTILARSSDRDLPIMNRAEMLAFARDAVRKFGVVWSISDKIEAPALRYARILCDGRELVRLSVPSELSLQ
jgi:hypothetical protein